MKDSKTVRTETTVRQYDADGNMIVETVTTVLVTKPETDDNDDQTGMYL